MAGLRRMTVRPGGIGGPVATPGNPGNQADSTPRTMPGRMSIAKPYRVGASPAAKSNHPWLDPSGIMFWRLLFLGLAVAYIGGYHLTIGRLRVRI